MMTEIDMDDQDFLFFNFPLIFFNITANIFYAWSLFLDRGKLKQALSVLLGYLVFLTVMHCVTLIAWYFTSSRVINASLIVWIILGMYSHCSVTCYVWLSFYYYVSIVPAKRVLMVWTKKNIKSVIFVALTGESMLYLANGVLKFTKLTSRFNYITNQTEQSNNSYDIEEAFTAITQVYILFCMLTMMFSSFSTAHYLVKHIRNLEKSASSLTSPKIQSQIRVTIAGVLQGLLYLFYYIFYLTTILTFIFQPRFCFSSRVLITATTLFFSVTTVNIGISQTVIRQRAADVFRGLKALCGVNMETHDVTLHTSPVT